MKSLSVQSGCAKLDKYRNRNFTVFSPSSPLPLGEGPGVRARASLYQKISASLLSQVNGLNEVLVK